MFWDADERKINGCDKLLKIGINYIDFSRIVPPNVQRSCDLIFPALASNEHCHRRNTKDKCNDDADTLKIPLFHVVPLQLFHILWSSILPLSYR
jgi:hypothetical protein